MMTDDPNVRFSVSFVTAPRDLDKPLREAIERLEKADARWKQVLELASARLTDRGRYAFGLALGALESGPAPRLLPFSMEPDDEAAAMLETEFMPPTLLTTLGLTIPNALGFGHQDAIAVQGLVSAVHRLLRIAKTRP